MAESADRPEADVEPWPRSSDDGLITPDDRRIPDEFGMPLWVGRFVWAIFISALILFAFGWVGVLVAALA